MSSQLPSLFDFDDEPSSPKEEKEVHQDNAGEAENFPAKESEPVVNGISEIEPEEPALSVMESVFSLELPDELEEDNEFEVITDISEEVQENENIVEERTEDSFVLEFENEEEEFITIDEIENNDQEEIIAIEDEIEPEETLEIELAPTENMVLEEVEGETATVDKEEEDQEEVIAIEDKIESEETAEVELASDENVVLEEAEGETEENEVATEVISNGVEQQDEIILPDWKLDKNYYTIGEVAKMFEVNVSKIRFWTTQFKIKTRTTRKGDRLYRPEQIAELRLIHHLVTVKKYTIKGAKEVLKSGSVQLEKKLDIREELQKLYDVLFDLKESI